MNRPKCLVDFGGKAILDHQIDAMLAVGVEEFVIVVGYEAGQVKAHCAKKLQQQQQRGGVRFVANSDFDKTNSLYSLSLAAHELDGDVFLLNCDIVFDPRIARRLTDIECPNVIAVDSQASRPLGEMCVKLSGDNHIEAIGKQLNPGTSDALSAQVARFCGAGARSLAAEIARLSSAGGEALFPTSAYGPLIEARQMFGVDVTDLPWAEIDSLHDYEQALEMTLPSMAVRSF